MATRSVWKNWPLPTQPPLDRDVATEIVIVGGGLTGITAAYLLARAGKRVVLIDRDRCGGHNTGSTTAHLTYVTDQRLPVLVRDWGKEKAQLVWQGGETAVGQIEQIVRTAKIDCDFQRVPGYLHQAIVANKEADTLEEDEALAKELGFEAELLQHVPLIGRPGIRFVNQALFHPLKYLGGLMTAARAASAQIYERTEATSFAGGNGDRIEVEANGETLRCDYLILATDPPLQGLKGLLGATLVQAKLAAYTSYAIGARLPKSNLPQALFWDTSDPYFYLRCEHKADNGYAVFGGLDHKTGQEVPTGAIFAQLERHLHKVLPGAVVDHEWSGQIQECHDGLPLIGETTPGQFIATGYSGTGLTFGTLAAMMAVDAVLKRHNPWADLLSPSRSSLRHEAWRYVKENLDFPKQLVADRFRGAEGDSLADLAEGEGKILRLEGQQVAAFRDPQGTVTLLSPVCPHLGCHVAWNDVEESWDCPCHGSRFKGTGELLAGPAEAGLTRYRESNGVALAGECELALKRS